MTLPTGTPTDFATRELYGGAITTTIPGSFLDASTVRPVPSNQEVFTSPTPNLPISIIFDLLEAQSGTPQEVASTHFSDIASSPFQILNVSSNTGVTPQLPKEQNNGQDFEVVSAEGTIVNEKNETGYTVVIMAIVRMVKVGTDFVVSVNIQVEGEDVQKEEWFRRPGVEGLPQGEKGDLVKVGEEVARRAIADLRVVDWGLFVEE
ncbi:Mog1p/PsbP-like protein [Ascobolus immersus RN42]|uniref:Mog1p/PsbP-like protein n=1 Tax=Ascobolus immersus RN42 TaxID=1160509 RepID=A0A3N4IVL6_ASCIM|nr:Mog1p/PsbP-like protein [Ascobolus immersus RN42]